MFCEHVDVYRFKWKYLLIDWFQLVKSLDQIPGLLVLFPGSLLSQLGLDHIAGVGSTVDSVVEALLPRAWMGTDYFWSSWEQG